MNGDQAAGPDRIHPSEPTPYLDVNAVLVDLLARVHAVLGEKLHGVYLFGSLVTGAFDPGRSDVDVLVVTNAPVSAEIFAALQSVHQDLADGDSPWATEVEVYYLTRAALRRADSSFGEHLKVNRGVGVLESLHPDPGWLIQSHILYTLRKCVLSRLTDRPGPADYGGDGAHRVLGETCFNSRLRIVVGALHQHIARKSWSSTTTCSSCASSRAPSRRTRRSSPPTTARMGCVSRTPSAPT